MYRIDNSTASPTRPTPNVPGPIPNGFFTGGNPGVVPATIVDADWLNMLQEELANVVTAAGETLSKSNTGQLLAALITLIAAGGGGGGATQPYDLFGGCAGLMTQPNQILLMAPILRAFTIPAGMSNSRGRLTVPPANPLALTVLQNTTAVGTINWAAGGLEATFSMTSATSFATTDTLFVHGPATPDPAAQNCAFGIWNLV